MSRNDRDTIIRYLTGQRSPYQGLTEVRIARDGSVTAQADPMPNTNQAGRIFVGWDTELLNQATTPARSGNPGN